MKLKKKKKRRDWPEKVGHGGKVHAVVFRTTLESKLVVLVFGSVLSCMTRG